MAQILFPNQVVSDFAYDPLTGRPATISHTRGLAEIDSLDYGYDAEGKITSIAEPAGTRSFTYDALQQVTAGGLASAPESYSYDGEGNRLASHLSTGHNHDAANRLLSDDSFIYLYDANGNLESKTEIATSAITTYTWDVQNRLLRIDLPNATAATYRYDADGRRIEKDVNGTVTRYVYDGDAILLEYDGANTLQARYSHGLEIDQPLALERGGQEYAYHVDHLGSVRKLTSAAGAVANSYATEAFGRFELRSESVANSFTFTAREFDSESGLLFYRARYYDPVAGRFISEDPIGFQGGDVNLFRYTFNIPILFKDPEGKIVGLSAPQSQVATRFSGCIAGAAAGFLAITGEALGTIVSAIINGQEDQLRTEDLKARFSVEVSFTAAAGGCLAGAVFRAVPEAIPVAFGGAALFRAAIGTITGN